MNITRTGNPLGRWPQYNVVVDGVDLGRVRRVMVSGDDRLSPRARRDGWEAAGRIFSTRAAAEAALFDRNARSR